MESHDMKTMQRASDAGNALQLDENALERARQNLDEGAVTPSYGPWRDGIVKLLNDALATELVCVLRYKRHYFTAVGLASLVITSVEGFVLSPFVLGRASRTNTVAVFVSLMFWTWLWGPMGAFLSSPLLIVALITKEHLLPEDSPQLPPD